MAKSTNIKKIEKLRKRIEEIDERVKNDLQLKQELVKEIEGLEAESILIACKSSNITVGEAVESFGLYNKLKNSGLSVSDIDELISSNDTKNTEDVTLSPMDTKSDEEDKNV
jgi:hypothetical protein